MENEEIMKLREEIEMLKKENNNLLFLTDIAKIDSYHTEQLVNDMVRNKNDEFLTASEYHLRNLLEFGLLEIINKYGYEMVRDYFKRLKTDKEYEKQIKESDEN